VTVPPGYSTVYVSGTTAGVSDPSAPKGSVAAYGSTAVQTESAIKRIQAALQAQGLDLGDIVSMRVYLVGDPATGGVMDFKGMMAAYSKHFGTPDQPNRPSRTTVQVSNLVAPGLLVEIETVAAKPPVRGL
jgi:enamine deaminase RidA (YjgF/YER057c/UK114 family)